MKNKKNNKNSDFDDVLMMFHHKMVDLFKKEAEKSGYTLTHFEVLMYVAERGPVTMKSIASWLHITPPSASALVDKLVGKKLLSRVEKDNDRRTIHITLGGEAHKLFKQLREKKIAIFKSIFAKLDKQEKESLVRILEKCIN